MSSNNKSSSNKSSSNTVLTKFTHFLVDLYQKFIHHGHSGEIPIKKIILETLHNTIDHIFSLYKNDLLVVSAEYNIDFEIESQEKDLKNKVDKVINEKLKEIDVLDLKVDHQIAKVVRDAFKSIANGIFDGIDISEIPNKIRKFIKENPNASHKKINKFANSLIEDMCKNILANFVKNISTHVMDDTIDIVADKMTDASVAAIDAAKIKIDEKLDGPAESIALAAMDIVRDNVDDVIDAAAAEVKDKIHEKIKEGDKKGKSKELLDDKLYPSTESPNAEMDPNDPNFVSELLHKLTDKVEDTIETIHDQIDTVIDATKDKIADSDEAKKIQEMSAEVSKLSRFRDEEDFINEIEKLGKVLKEMNAHFDIKKNEKYETKK